VQQEVEISVGKAAEACKRAMSGKARLRVIIDIAGK